MYQNLQKISFWFLRFSVDKYDHDSLIGDFTEIYQIHLNENGPVKAILWLWSQILKSIPSYIYNTSQLNLFVFRYYLSISLRNFRRNLGYSIINVIGLISGFVCCIFILIYLFHEFSYDRFHPDSDRIYRVAKIRKKAAQEETFAPNSSVLAPILKQRFSEVQHAARMAGVGTAVVRYGVSKFFDDKIKFADPDIFNIFRIQFLQGNPEIALSAPFSILLTQPMVEKIFGAENPIGKIIKIDSLNYKVTGIIKKNPTNTHQKYSMIASLQSLAHEGILDNWDRWHCQNYIKLGPGVDPIAFENKIRFLTHEYLGEKLKNEGTVVKNFLQPVTDIHFNSNLAWDTEPSGNLTYLYLLAFAGIFTFSIACLNYVNFTTARTAKRSLEVDIRKAIGAYRGQLISQFTCESFFVSVISIIGAIIIVMLLLPLFSQVIDIEFSIYNLLQPYFIFCLMLIPIITSIVGGSYPAIILTAFKTSSIIKGYFSIDFSKTIIRKTLIISQFTLSIILIIGTIHFYKQLEFMKNRHLGLDIKRKLVLQFHRPLIKKHEYEQLKAEFLVHNSITGATFSSTVPGRWLYYWHLWPTGERVQKDRMTHCFQVDKDFLKEFDIKLAVGRSFQQNDVPGSVWIINEAAVKAFDWNSPEEAITKNFYPFRANIVGVTKNFHFRGLQSPIEPVAFFYMNEDFRYLTLNIKTDNLPETISFVKEKYDEIWPDGILNYFFLDEDFDQQYKTEERIGKIISFFTLIGVIISCLGLLGLITYIAEQRIKEISIRKVLGASIYRIVILLTNEFLKSLSIATIVAWVIAYFIINMVLDYFSYRIDLNIAIFISSALLALLIAAITVSYQAIRVAYINPIQCLKHE